MAEEAGQSRTESASPRRREDARRQGQVAYSADLSSTLVLTAALTVLWLSGPQMISRLLLVLRTELQRQPGGDWTTTEPRRMLATLLAQGASACLLLVVVAIVVGVGAGALQAGLRISFQPLSPNWSRLNPFSGWRRLLSTKSWVRMAMTAGKGALAAVIGYSVIRADAPRWLAAGSLLEAVVAAWQSGLRLAIGLSLAMLALAAIDYLFQRWKHEADLRMTRQELIEERRSDEGDPHIRARMRRLLREAAQNRTLQDVPAATAVIRNPTHFAVAIRYQRGVTPAPLVVAKGHGAFARRIIDCAERHGVPVLRRPPLARALYALADVGQEIPADLYHAVAEILAFVYGRSR